MSQSDQQTAGPPSSVPWRQRLWEPCDIASVAFLRVAFGAIMVSHVVYFLQMGAIDYYFRDSAYHLKYFGFEWVRALGAAGMWRIHLLMGLAAIGVGLGMFYRLSAVLLFVTYTYAFLAEAAYFQNHYYMMSLMSFVFILIPAHRAYSVDAAVFPEKSSPFIPNWCRWVLMFLVALPYFYGGLAKLNGDWLHAMPLRIWLAQKAEIPVIGPYVAQPWMAWVLSYGGLLLDLFIVPLLLWRKTRLAAYVVAGLFHLTNSVLFSIDVFPWMMLLMTTIFFAPDWPRKLLRRPPLKVTEEAIAASRNPPPLQRAALGVVCVFVVWQLVLPLRHFVYPGDANWTDEGDKFAWHMMLRHKDVFIRFYATDGVTGETYEIPIGKLLNLSQVMDITHSPEQIAAVSHYLADVAAEAGLKRVKIHAVAITSLDGRKPQLLFDPGLDLQTVERSWKHQTWIAPLTEPLRAEPWDVPSNQWPAVVGVELPNAKPLPLPPVQDSPRGRALPGFPGQRRRGAG